MTTHITGLLLTTLAIWRAITQSDYYLNDIPVTNHTMKITLSSETITDENSFEQPLKISPKKETYESFSNNFVYDFKPNSLTVLRIKKN